MKSLVEMFMDTLTGNKDIVKARLDQSNINRLIQQSMKVFSYLI